MRALILAIPYWVKRNNQLLSCGMCNNSSHINLTQSFQLFKRKQKLKMGRKALSTSSVPTLFSWLFSHLDYLDGEEWSTYPTDLPTSPHPHPKRFFASKADHDQVRNQDQDYDPDTQIRSAIGLGLRSLECLGRSSQAQDRKNINKRNWPIIKATDGGWTGCWVP